jgi:ELWxxDGT repeat protein
MKHIGVMSLFVLSIASTVGARSSPSILPTGPSGIRNGDASALYSATITLDVLQDFAVQVLSYRGNNPTPFNTIEQWTYGPTNLVNYFVYTVNIHPGPMTGEKFTFKANLITTNPPQVIPATNVIVTVTAGTYKVAAIRAIGSSACTNFKIGTVGGVSQLFFSASDGLNYQQLYKSDGTAAGTVMVKQINPFGDSLPQQLSIGVVGGVSQLLFAAEDDSINFEPWKSDGTTAGTVKVAIVNPIGNSACTNFKIGTVGGISQLFFSATDGAHNIQLWQSDGTTAGTAMVKQINPIGNSNPQQLQIGVVGGVSQLLFAATDDGSNFEPWKSDGTTAGTVKVATVNPFGNSGCTNFKIGTVGGVSQLFFSANDGLHYQQLWKSDGTAAGTVMVKQINPNGDSTPQELQVGIVGGVSQLLFAAADQGTNFQPWKSDGTAAGTSKIAIVNPSGSSRCANFTIGIVGGTSQLFFTATDGVHGIQLWKSDGTAAGTVMVKAINGVGGAGPNNLVIGVAGGVSKLLFGADDGVGDELWTSDGTAAGTVKVKDINPVRGSGPNNMKIGIVGGVSQLLFAADDGVGYEPWASNGHP